MMEDKEFATALKVLGHYEDFGRVAIKCDVEKVKPARLRRALERLIKQLNKAMQEKHDG